MENLTYKSDYGVAIKMCCASCRHKQQDAKVRVCMRGEGLVSPSSYCMDWEVVPQLCNAGKGGGRIKKREYLAYCLDRLDADYALYCERASKKLAHKHITFGQIREEYEKKYGSIYLTK